MAHKWYYERNGARFGPYSAAELKGCATAGKLRPQDTVWQDGIEKGSLASRVKYLFDAPAAPVAVREPPSPTPEALVEADERAPSEDPSDFSEDADLLPLEDSPPLAPAKAAPAPEKPEGRPKRVLSVKGGMIVSQDGITLRYRKKCAVCSHEDNSIATAPIRSGTTRVNYFCPKCKKSRPVEIQGVG
jgi:hypothetical protein